MDSDALLDVLGQTAPQPSFLILLSGHHTFGRWSPEQELLASPAPRAELHVPVKAELYDAPAPLSPSSSLCVSDNHEPACVSAVSSPAGMTRCAGLGEEWTPATAALFQRVLGSELATTPRANQAVHEAGVGIGALIGWITSLYGQLRIVLAGPADIVEHDTSHVAEVFLSGLEHGSQASLHGRNLLDLVPIGLSPTDLTAVTEQIRSNRPL